MSALLNPLRPTLVAWATALVALASSACLIAMPAPTDGVRVACVSAALAGPSATP